MNLHQKFRFNTELQDRITVLCYYGYRYYNPQLGRWLSRDPIGEEGGLNLYRFVGNDGVNRFDQLGEKACKTYHKVRVKDGKKQGRTRTQNNNAILLNGCGTSGWSGALVPNSYFWTVFFTDACNIHDGCYGKCGSEKWQCDKNLGDDMANACKARYGRANPNLYVCMMQAATYMNAVKLLGDSAYESSQNWHCKWECCE